MMTRCTEARIKRLLANPLEESYSIEKPSSNLGLTTNTQAYSHNTTRVVSESIARIGESVDRKTVVSAISSSLKSPQLYQKGLLSNVNTE